MVRNVRRGISQRAARAQRAPGIYNIIIIWRRRNARRGANGMRGVSDYRRLAINDRLNLRYGTSDAASDY